MSHALHEELSSVAPQEQHNVYQSLLGRMWKTMNTPLGDLFHRKPQKMEYLPFPVLIDGQQLAITKQYLDNGASRTQQDWWKREGPETLLGVKQQYAMLRWLYHNSKDGAGMEFLRLFRKDFSAWWKWYHTGTRIQYGNSLEAVIDELQPDKSIASTSVQVPEFTKYSECWSYLVLAKEQPASQLGCVEHIPENVQPFLNALLGKGYEEAGAVFQYCQSQRNGNLREVQLWTPTAIYRNVQRSVVLGVVSNGRFDLIAVDYVGFQGPARGVVLTSAQKLSSGN